MLENFNAVSSEEKKQFFDKQYKKIVEEGISGYDIKETYEEACQYVLKLCLSLNDYIHANNILQCYKSEVSRERSPWYHYYSIIVHGKRYPKYFLNKTQMLVKKVKRYYVAESKKDLNEVLINLLYFYVKLFDNYKDVFIKDLRTFTNYFINNPLEDHHRFNYGITQLHELLNNEIDFEDINFDSIKIDDEKPKQQEPKAKEESIIYNDNAKVLIIGDLSISKDKVYGIAKSIGFDKEQIEIVDDFSVIKTYDIKKLQYNYNYCGIIFGPIPHSSKSAQGDSSMITHVENKEGYPYNVRATANGKLKITKSSLSMGLSEIYSNYSVTNS